VLIPGCCTPVHHRVRARADAPSDRTVYILSLVSRLVKQILGLCCPTAAAGARAGGWTMPEPVTLVAFGGGMLGLMAHLARRYFEAAKQVLDVILATILLVLCAPVILICALIIRLSSKGSVIYSQTRVGKDGKLFKMYKLRTMIAGAEQDSGAVWADSDDLRVMPVCRWMRRSHVDELLQLINVLKGEMSLVGPRPERPEILNELEQQCPEVKRRLAVRPGITGLAQVRNGYDTDIESFRRKLQADLEYIARRGWGMELAILMKTLTKLNDRTAH